MEKFNNIEMTEDELDQVAGGQTYVFLKRKPEGGIRYEKYGFEGDIEKFKALMQGKSVDSVSFKSFSASGGIMEDQLDAFVKKQQENGYIVVKQWER